MDNFNKLTPGETERLSFLAEEASKIVQAVTKILRHGYNSYHPDDPNTDNRKLLSSEINDLKAVLHMLDSHSELALPYDVTCHQNKHVMAAVERKLRYSHHQLDENGYTRSLS